MDAMALLCTLHADGPTTLRRLRANGIRNLAALKGEEADSISRVLDIPAAAARRFVREAALLEARVDEEALEVVGGEPPSLAMPQTVEEPERGSLSGRDQRLVDKVLERWRDAEQGEPTLEVAAEPVATTPLMIEPGSIDGLTAELSQSLAGLGVGTAAALANTDTLALSEATGIGFSTIRRLQFLARRVESQPVQEERLSVEERPRLEGLVRAWELPPEDLPEASDAGGPFA